MVHRRCPETCEIDLLERRWGDRHGGTHRSKPRHQIRGMYDNRKDSHHVQGTLGLGRR